MITLSTFDFRHFCKYKNHFLSADGVWSIIDRKYEQQVKGNYLNSVHSFKLSRYFCIRLQNVAFIKVMGIVAQQCCPLNSCFLINETFTFQSFIIMSVTSWYVTQMSKYNIQMLCSLLYIYLFWLNTIHTTHFTYISIFNTHVNLLISAIYVL